MLIVAVHDRLGGLPLAAVIEVMRPLPVEPVVGAPDFVLGLSVIRGEPIPVVDLAHLLGGRAGSPSRFVVVRVAARRVALAVDAVVGIRDISDAQIRQLPPLLQAGESHGVAAVGALDSDLFMVLTAAHLVPGSLLDAVQS
jgi:purine-binding chemotaxis protein CheW